MTMEEVMLKEEMGDRLQIDDIATGCEVQLYLFGDYNIPAEEPMVMKLLQRRDDSR